MMCRLTRKCRWLVCGVPTLLVAVAASTVGASQLMDVPRLTVVDDEAAGVTVELAELAPGDEVEIVGEVGALAPQLETKSWDERIVEASGGHRWRARVRRADTWAVHFGDVGAGHGSRYRVLVRRVEPVTGDELQVTLPLGASASGGVVVGNAAVGRVRHMLRLTLAGNETGLAGVKRDPAGRLHVRRTDPRAARLASTADRVEPYLEARVTTLSLGSVSGSNAYNQTFQPYICDQDPWWGTSITIDGAPSGATVTSLDVEYVVYHSVDVSRFMAGLWHRDPPGGDWADQIVLYGGGSSGAHWHNGSQNGITAYNGSEVNTDYIIGCCNIYGHEDGYLDYWTITVYYDSGTPIDLVADSVSLLRDDVAAGSEAGVFYEAHVAGSGDVGVSTDTAFYLSTDASITPGDRRLETWSESASLSAGDTFGAQLFEHIVSIPGDVTPGDYYMGIRLDDSGALAETDENNNTAAASFTVVASSQQPNLVASDCSVDPGQADPGDTVTLEYRARNTGGTGAPSFNFEAFLSADPTFDYGSDTALAGLDVMQGWPAGYDSGTSNINLVLPSALADGTYYIGMAFDPEDAINETNETDNWCATPLTIGSAAPPGVTDWLIPAAASTPGYGSSDWRTEIAIVNPDTAAHTVNVYYVAKGQSWPGTLLSGPISLDPDESEHLVDPLAGLNPTSGLVYVDCDSAGPMVTSRTYNLASGGATFGQGIPAVDYGGTCPSAYVLPLVHSVSGEFHTNLGLVSTDAGSTTWQITIYSGTGAQLATKSYTRSAAFTQIDDLFDKVGLGGVSVSGAWIRVEVTSGCPSYWTTYASVVDDRTGDPTYVLPVPMP